MKKFNFVFLTLALLILLTACAPAPAEEGNSTSETEAVTEENVPKLTVVSSGKTEFKIIRPEESDGASGQLFAAFFREFEERFCSIETEFDVMALIKPVAPDAKEILLGDTNREESALLSEKLSASGGNRFGIMATDSKIVINGTGWYQRYLALDYFLNNFVSADGTSVEIECGFEYISDASEDKSFEIAELLVDGRGVAFAATEKVLKFQNKNGGGTPQGGCTDGKYVYVGMMGTGDSGDYGVVSKYDLATGELIKFSERLPTFHTNDLTYDAKNNRIVIATLDAGWTRLSFVDADTLEFLGDLTTPMGIRGLEYLPESNTYVAAGFNIEIMILDEKFNKISSHICADQTLMTQGLYSDGEYVYDPRYLEGKAVHLLVVEDMDGNLLASANLYGLSGAEPEHMFKLNGKFYIGCNHSGYLYEVAVIPQNWW